MRTLLRFFFYLLYHPFAFAYDLVAAAVSLGRWKDWLLSVVPFIEGERILEIGPGPGHLQRILIGRGLFVVGLDESAPMVRLARSNLMNTLDFQPVPRLDPLSFAGTHPDTQGHGYAKINLTRGLAQALPFPAASFDTVVATFPAEYIFELVTLDEAYRVLAPDGRFVILPGASILGRGLMDRIMAFLFLITGQTPPNLPEILRERSREPFTKAHFQVQLHELEIRSSRVFILVAIKKSRLSHNPGNREWTQETQLQ